MSIAQSETLHLQPFQGFRCTSCGLCCTRPWGVPVDAAVEPGIRASAVYAEKQRQGYVPIHLDDDGFTRVARSPKGDCLFLEDDLRCSLHAELGPLGKPSGCQLFPYRAVRTPDGVFFSQSWVCPPVVAGTDDNVEENREQLAQLVRLFPEAAGSLSDEEFPVALSREQRISWNDYRDLEERLLRGFDPNRPALSLLALTVDVMAEAAGPLGAIPEDTSLEEALLTMYLQGLLMAVETQDHLERQQQVGEALQGGPSVRSIHGDVVLPEFGLEACRSPRLLAAFERYVLNMVLGKNLLRPSVVRQLLALACTYPLLSFYGEAFRRDRGEAELTLEAMTLAFEVVESELYHSANMAPFFIDFEATLEKLSAA